MLQPIYYYEITGCERDIEVKNQTQYVVHIPHSLVTRSIIIVNDTLNPTRITKTNIIVRIMASWVEKNKWTKTYLVKIMISTEMILLGATILIVIGGWTRMLRGNVRDR